MVADLEAGIGTLTRLEDKVVDVALVVVEPTAKSLDVGARAAAMARDKCRQLVVVANRVRGDDDLALVRATFPDDHVVTVPDDRSIVDADRAGVAPLDLSPSAPAVQALVGLTEQLSTVTS